MVIKNYKAPRDRASSQYIVSLCGLQFQYTYHTNVFSSLFKGKYSKKPFTGIDQFGNNIVIWKSQVSSSKTRLLGRVEAVAFYII